MSEYYVSCDCEYGKPCYECMDTGQIGPLSHAEYTAYYDNERKRKYELDELISQITPENRHEYVWKSEELDDTGGIGLKILYVTGDDYAAMYVEDDLGVDEAVKMVEENDGKITIANDEVYAELSIFEFKDVDPAFVDFVKHKIMNYDMSKHVNFFVIKEARR